MSQEQDMSVKPKTKKTLTVADLAVITREAYLACQQEKGAGLRFSLDDIEAAVARKLKAKGNLGDLAEALIHQQVQKVDHELRKGRSPDVQPALPGMDEWMLDAVLVVGPRARVTARNALIEDGQQDKAYKFENLQRCHEAYALVEQRFNKLFPYWNAHGVTMEDAVKAYLRDHPKEEAAS
jgi:hypothetical protein